jgi:hypothetical protein
MSSVNDSVDEINARLAAAVLVPTPVPFAIAGHDIAGNISQLNAPPVAAIWQPSLRRTIKLPTEYMPHSQLRAEHVWAVMPRMAGGHEEQPAR